MELLIHFGIYKTGSSFLQTICARNRQQLKDNGVWFPLSEREDDMISGKISPGNGNRITDYLKQFNISKVNELVSKWNKEAILNGCSRILISDEALIHAFAIERSLTILNQAISKVGISNIRCFAFFRNPIDHSISTFKHRAKKGTIFVFKDWVSKQYETPKVIEEFLKNFSKVDFDWQFGKYDKNGLNMANLFFKDWLMINNIEIYVSSEINPSLTLSELSVIQNLGKSNRSLVKSVYNGFLSLSKSQKANDTNVEMYYRKMAYLFLIEKREVFDSLNKILPIHHQLVFDNFSDEDHLESPVYQFTDIQMETLTRSISKGRRIDVQIKYFFQQIFKKFRGK